MPTASPTPNFNRVTLRAKYIGFDGLPIVGDVTFAPRAARMVDTAALTIIIGRPRTVTIAGDGTFSIDLPATDDPDINVDFTYQVTENFVGGEVYDILVPLANATAGLDLATVTRTYPVTAPDGQFGSAQFGTSAGTATEGNDPRVVGAMQKAANLSDVQSVSTARTNLQLGTAALASTGISNGNVPVLGAGGVLATARIGGATPTAGAYVDGGTGLWTALPANDNLTTVSASDLPAGTVQFVRKNGATWGPRPTIDPEKLVMWIGAEPSPPIVTSGTGGMYAGDIRSIV